MNKNIITTPAIKVKDATLFVADYTEVGVDKTVDVTHVAIEKIVDGAQTTACATMIAGSVVKVAWSNHRTAKADRLIERTSRREARKVAKVLAQEQAAFEADQAS